MKKIKLNNELCIGCGACVSISDVFEFDDDGYAFVKEENFEKLDDLKKEEVIDSKEGCPVDAISIEE